MKSSLDYLAAIEATPTDTSLGMGSSQAEISSTWLSE
jgi:hypothetical protein